ncbi:MAG: hypothetical protein H0U95_07030 [Bacteroidetes bacterium]|nr:hypothetical protein [Bacteroidota bacterium]
MINFTKIKSLLCLALLFFAGTIFSQVSQADSTLTSDPSDSLDNSFNVPIFNSTGGDIDSDLGQQESSSLLQSSRDLFSQFAIFHFNAARYRIRGYSTENLSMMLNGIDINSPETGFAAFGEWGGLFNVAPFSEYRLGNGASRYGFSGPAGYNNIDTKASSARKGTRIAYGTTNRTYRNRLTISHSTGMMQNGWALKLVVSGSSGNQVYIPGTYSQGNTFYLGLDKKINNKHLLSFTGYVSPSEFAGRTSAQLEAYELTNDHYYNRAWGLQDGKVRNSTVRKTIRPTFMVSHIMTPNNTSKLTTSLFGNFGKSSVTGINWNNSPNPQPDYYKYLPSYYYNQGLTEQGDALTALWQNDVNTRQINWDRLIAMNQANIYTIPSQAGQGLNTTDTRSRYIVEDRVEDLKNFGFTSVYNKRIENLFLSAGINGNIYRNHKYKTLNDLLGGTFWLDYDQFAQNLGVSSTFPQNNINNPDQKIYKGDKFGYDFNININRAQAWGQAEYSIGKFDMYGALALSTMQVWREGFVANGKFPTTSQGKSELISFMNYGVKGGLTYKINGRNFLLANANFLTRPPEVNTMFISPETRNDITRGVTSEKVTSYEFSYLAKYPGFKARATYYNTSINNQSNMRIFWHDLYNANVNYFLTGLNEKHQGVELTVEKTLFTSHILQGVFGYGQYYYTNRPKAQAWQTNNNTELYTDKTVYYKNYYIGGTPQLVSAFTYKYMGKKFWNVSATINYFGELYTQINPDRRTEDAVAAYVDGDPQINDVVGQQKLPDFYTVNLNAGKSFRIKGKYYLNFNGGINNLLNNQSALNLGYEQMRWDIGQLNRFQNKYQYMMGLTYRVNVSFSF